MTKSEILNTMKLLDIKEVTSNRQALNGTREFELPIKYPWGRKIRLASFKTGYVRNQNSCYSNYQLNPTYKRKKKFVFLESTGTVTKTYNTISRALIYSGLARLNYMLEFYLRNYNINTNKAG